MRRSNCCCCLFTKKKSQGESIVEAKNDGLPPEDHFRQTIGMVINTPPVMRDRASLTPTPANGMVINDPPGMKDRASITPTIVIEPASTDAVVLVGFGKPIIKTRGSTSVTGTPRTRHASEIARLEKAETPSAKEFTILFNFK